MFTPRTKCHTLRSAAQMISNLPNRCLMLTPGTRSHTLSSAAHRLSNPVCTLSTAAHRLSNPFCTVSIKFRIFGSRQILDVIPYLQPCVIAVGVIPYLQPCIIAFRNDEYKVSNPVFAPNKEDQGFLSSLNCAKSGRCAHFRR